MPLNAALMPLARRRGRALLLLLVGLLFALPLLLLVTGPLRAPGLPPPTRLQLWPDEPSLQALQLAFSTVPLARALWNSFWVCALAVPLTWLTASWAALALRLVDARTRALLAGTLLVLAMVPVTAIWIPRFIVFSQLGAVGTHLPLVAPALMGGSPLFVLLFWAAMRRIPDEQLEAARLEGAGLLRLWWRVVMPQLRATSTAVALLTVVLFWGNFIDPLLYLRRESQFTAPPMLHALEALGPTNWSVLLAGALVVTLPVALAFGVAQRFFWSDERNSSWSER
jgi:multiple sugar transport system permease protein